MEHLDELINHLKPLAFLFEVFNEIFNLNKGTDMDCRMGRRLVVRSVGNAKRAIHDIFLWLQVRIS